MHTTIETYPENWSGDIAHVKIRYIEETESLELITEAKSRLIDFNPDRGSVSDLRNTIDDILTALRWKNA